MRKIIKKLINKFGYNISRINKKFENIDLNELLSKKINYKNPSIFDVGGNKGGYSKLLLQGFPNATIHVFEPNPNIFKILSDNLGSSVILNNLGISAESRELELFFDAENRTSEQATSDPEILKKLPKPQM